MRRWKEIQILHRVFGCKSQTRHFASEREILTPYNLNRNPGDKKDGALKKFLIDKIRVSGPITVAEYMKTAISAPQIGYYGQYSDKQKVFGSSGDFVTAPELTQLFGDMLGVWIFHELSQTGHTDEWQLVESGPGSGQLMNDLLNVFDKFKESKLSVHLVETSDALIEEQERLLCSNNSSPAPSTCAYVKKNKSKTGVPVYWYKNLDDVPQNFSVFVANEFLDALPVHQLCRDEQGDKWKEIYVSLNNNDQLCFMQSKGENLHTRGLLTESIRSDTSRKYWEISPEAGTYVNQIAERLTYNGGFALIVDYGHNDDRKDLSLRAYSKHEQVDPLSKPGQIDLTADVNFGYLKSLISDRTQVFGPNTQREFLAQLGIEMRVRRVVRACTDQAKQEDIIKSYNFLMGDMGEKFLVMSIFPKTLTNILNHRGGPSGFAESKKKIVQVEVKKGT